MHSFRSFPNNFLEFLAKIPSLEGCFSHSWDSSQLPRIRKKLLPAIFIKNMETLLPALEALSINFSKESHQEVDSFNAWVDTIKSIDPSAGITKTLVLNPSKGPNKNPIMTIALEDSKFSVSTLAKFLGNKDARMATDDLVKSTFGTDKINGFLI